MGRKKTPSKRLSRGWSRLDTNLSALREWFQEERRRDSERVWIEDRLQESIELAQMLRRGKHP